VGGVVVTGREADSRPALELARAAYRELSLYDPKLAPCRIDLSDNTNRFGVPPAAERVLREASSEAITRYPSVYSGSLKEALASYAGVSANQIVTGCGSDDVIDSAIRAFTEPGERLAFPAPTFAMVPYFARMNGLMPVSVPYADDGSLDVDGLIESEARVIYVCEPNNPTGTRAGRASIEALLARHSGLVILDEAYAEFDGDGFLARAPLHSRLIVTRTLSKAFGLAGLRIGYAAGPETLIREVEKSRGPFKVGTLAERAAVAALIESRDWVRAHVEQVVRNRARFIAALGPLGFSPLPSATNFVLVPVANATESAAAMRRAGVAVRAFPGLPRIGDALRITIGPWEMMQECLARMREAIA
jgi:histidinol-phosphate aminotransferase